MIEVLFGVFRKHIFRILWYGAIILTIGFFLYSAFLKPTNTTNVAAGGRQVNIYGQDSSETPIFGCSAWRVNNKTYWKRSAPAFPTNGSLKQH